MLCGLLINTPKCHHVSPGFSYATRTIVLLLPSLLSLNIRLSQQFFLQDRHLTLPAEGKHITKTTL